MNKSLQLLILVTVGAGAFIYRQEQTIGHLRRTLEAHQREAQKLSGDNEQARVEIAELKRSNEVFKIESAALRERLAGDASAPVDPAAGPVQDNTAKPAAGFMKSFAKMFTDPEMRKSMRGQQMMGTRMMYADLAKELGLSAQDAEQLMEILADRQMDFAAAGMAALEDGGNKDAQTSKMSDATKRYEEQLKAVLGEDKYKQMQAYEVSMGDRLMMQQWDGQFAATGSPLEATQKDHLLALMREERLKSGGAAKPAQSFQAFQSEDGIKQFITTQEELNQRVLTRSREFLNADQVATLAKAQQQQVELLGMQIKMSRELMSGGKK